MLIDPTEPDEAGDCLVDPFTRRTDHSGKFLLSHGEQKRISTVGELEQALRSATGDVEEDRISERLVRLAKAAGQQTSDTPQQHRVGVEHCQHPVVRDVQDDRWLQSTGICGSCAAVEHAHLAEEITGRHQTDHRLAIVDRVGDRNRNPARQQDVKRVRRIALTEQHVTADERLLGGLFEDGGYLFDTRVGEEFRLGENVDVSHVTLDGTTVMCMPPHETEKVWTVVVAAGSSQRFGRAKQYELLDETRILDHSLAVARAASDGVVVVVPASDVGTEGGVAGGRTRSESVRNGLAAVPPEATIICVHDAARPFADAALYESVIAAVAAGADCAVPGIQVVDTIKVVDADGTVVSTPNRSSLRAIQTPQAFRSSVLRAAHAAGADGTDDAALVEANGGRTVVVPGGDDNRKITYPEDLEWARARAAAVSSGAVSSRAVSSGAVS